MSRPTPDSTRCLQVSGTRLSRPPARLPSRFPYPSARFRRSLPRDARTPVWALPISLAATLGIDFSFSSSGYLDVSVRRVPFHKLCIRLWMTGVHPRRVSPFRHLRVNGCLRLTAAFRSLPRLSSALSAKASTLRSCSLATSHLPPLGHGAGT